jgi:hypothetical protein
MAAFDSNLQRTFHRMVHQTAHRSITKRAVMLGAGALSFPLGIKGESNER